MPDESTEETIRRIERELRDIRHSLTGSEFGYKGVYQRLEQLETDMNEIKTQRKAVMIALSLTGLSTIGGIGAVLSQLFGGG